MAPSDPPRRRRYLLAALAILGACAASFALGVRHGAHPEDALGVREMVGAATRGPAACPAPKPARPRSRRADAPSTSSTRPRARVRPV